MSIPELATDTTKDKLAAARKAVGAGVSAAFAAAVPLVGVALTDGVVTGQEAGGVAAAFAGALVSVAYVTWQTVNKPTPSDVAALTAAVQAVPPIVLEAVPNSEQSYQGWVTLPDPDAPLPTAPEGHVQDEIDATPVADDYSPKHTA